MRQRQRTGQRTEEGFKSLMRLENACWRKFFQKKFDLTRISPKELNWQKDQEACWLYGPFHEANKEVMSIHDLELSAIKLKKSILQRKSDPAAMIQNLPPAILPNKVLSRSKTSGVLPRVTSGGISF